jgi:tetratricopeptide (TPR) repeat protein
MRGYGVGRSFRLLRRGPQMWCFCSLLLLGACSTMPAQQPVSSADLDWVRSGAGLLPQADTTPVEDPRSLLQVNDAMRRFAQDITGGKDGYAGRTDALMKALNGLHLQYDAQATLSAADAFAQRRVNCLSYTMLLVALGREIGLRMQFNDVEIPPLWDMGDNDTVVLYKHINVRVYLAPPMRYEVIDVSGDDYDHNLPQQLISDEEAEAQYYSNRAVEFRLAQRPAEALRYQLRALELAPQAAYLWTNLASLYLHQGQTQAARIAISHSLQLDPDDMLGADTAADVYDELGQRELAAYFHARVRDFMEQNPYYHYHRAVVALLQHQEQLAFDEVQAAIRLRDTEPRFYFLLAVVQQQEGANEEAEDSMRIAVRFSSNVAQQQRFLNKFARLAQQQRS